MRITIDAVGRVVLPKAVRAELGISGPTELEVVTRDGVVELAVPDTPAHVETRDEVPVIVAAHPMQPMTVEDVRAAIDRVRR
jgi:AbrB family looped-hinge helix DNA binding protein